MKILLRVLGVLAVIIAMVICALGVVRNFRDAKDAKELHATLAASAAQLETYKQQSQAMEGAEKDAMLQTIEDGENILKDIPSSATFSTAGILMGLLCVTSLVCGVFLFISNPKITGILLGISVIAALIAIVISPSIGGGFSQAATNRQVAIVAAIPAVLSALFAFLISRRKPKLQTV